MRHSGKREMGQWDHSSNITVSLKIIKYRVPTLADEVLFFKVTVLCSKLVRRQFYDFFRQRV